MPEHLGAVAGLIPPGVAGQRAGFRLGQHHDPIDEPAANRVHDEVYPVGPLDDRHRGAVEERLALDRPAEHPQTRPQQRIASRV